MKERYIYISQIKKHIKVSEKVYKEYYRPIWRTFRKVHDHRECSCPVKDWWKCEGDCLTCAFYLDTKTISLDAPVDNELSILDILSDDLPDIQSVMEEKALLEVLLQKLETLNPEGRKICKLVMQGKSETAIAQELNIPRNTYVYRKNKLFSALREALKKYL